MSATLKAIRLKVFARAGSRCEACLGPFGLDYGQLDHIFGRARAETFSSCWAVCSRCHEAKHRSRAAWLKHIIRHLARHGYAVELARAEGDLEWLKAKGLA